MGTPYDARTVQRTDRTESHETQAYAYRDVSTLDRLVVAPHCGGHRARFCRRRAQQYLRHRHPRRLSVRDAAVERPAMGPGHCPHRVAPRRGHARHSYDRSGPRRQKAAGAFFFIWTLYALGVTGTFGVILSVRALRSPRVVEPLVAP